VTDLALAFATPMALVALPAAALLLLAGGSRPGPRIAAVALGALGVWWLLGTGDLPDQTLRAATLLATAAFAALSARSTLSVTHRALVSLAVAAGGTAAIYLAFGWSWSRLLWWVEFHTGAALRLLMAQMSPSTDAGATAGADFEGTLNELIRTSGQLFPAAMALQLFVSLALAAVLVRRIAGRAVGVPPGRFADFRFSEHLGWLLAVGLVLVLVPPLAPARALGLNLLVVMGTLYALRGLAVVVFGLRAIRGGPVLYGAAALALFFLMPGVVLLGVVDAGLDLRRRRLPSTGA
jgi:hypothetical protein